MGQIETDEARIVRMDRQQLIALFLAVLMLGSVLAYGASLV